MQLFSSLVPLDLSCESDSEFFYHVRSLLKTKHLQAYERELMCRSLQIHDKETRCDREGRDPTLKHPDGFRVTPVIFNVRNGHDC